MKFQRSVFLLLLLVNLRGYAVGNESRDYWNPVTIYNDTSRRILYKFHGVLKGFEYSVAKHSSDIFHAGVGDKKSQIYVSHCLKKLSDGLCVQYSDFWWNGVNYNAELIQAIHIKASDHYTVTCLDGGTQSCVVND